MPEADAQVVVEVRAQLDKLDAGLKQAEAKVKQSAKKMDTAFGSAGGFGRVGNLAGQLLLGGTAVSVLARTVSEFRRVLDQELADPATRFADALTRAADAAVQVPANLAFGQNLAERIRNAIALSITGPQGLASISASSSGAVDPNIVNGQIASAIQNARIAEAKARVKAGTGTEADVRALEFDAASQSISNLIQSLRIQGGDKRFIDELERILKSTAELNRDAPIGGSAKTQKALIDSFDTVLGQFKIAGGNGVVRAQNEAAKATARNTKDIRDSSKKQTALLDRISRSLVGFA